MINALLEVLGAGLSLWASKEKNKYRDKYIKIKTEIYEELKKPYDQRDHAKLDELTFDLKLLCESFARSATNPE